MHRKLADIALCGVLAGLCRIFLPLPAEHEQIAGVAARSGAREIRPRHGEDPGAELPVEYPLALIEKQASSDPVEALRAASRIPDATLRAEARAKAMGVWAATDSEDARSWLEGQASNEVADLRPAFLSGWGSIDPMAAISWISANLPPAEQAGPRLAAIQFTAPEHYAATADALLAGAGDVWEDDPAMDHLLRSWKAAAPAEAEQWMADHHAGEEFHSHVSFGLKMPEPIE